MYYEINKNIRAVIDITKTKVLNGGSNTKLNKLNLMLANLEYIFI